MKLTPSQYVIKQFGGVTATARLIGRDPSTVSRWGRFVPQKLHDRVLEAAKRRHIDITERDLIRGR